MYAAAGAGYAATGSLAGALLPVVAPSTAVLAGVGVTLVLTGVGWWGETRHAVRSAQGADTAVAPVALDGSRPGGYGTLGDSGSEGAAIGRRGDPERRL